MYKLFIAFRYLVSRPISLVSIIGIFLSVGALIVVISVMSGFLRETKKFIRGTMSDIVVTPLRTAYEFEDHYRFSDYPPFETMKEVIEGVPGVIAVAPRFNRYGLITRSDAWNPMIGSSIFSEINGAVVLGIQQDLEEEVSDFRESLDAVTLETRRVVNLDDPFFVPDDKKDAKHIARDFPSILVGEDKFSRLMLQIGAVVTLATLDESFQEEGGDVKAFEQKFFVAGAFRSGNHQFDIQNVIIDMDAAREWVGEKTEVSEIYVKVDDYKKNGLRIKQDIKEALEEDFLVRVDTWEDRNAIFLGAVQNERTILGVILTFFILIATFNVYATISMMVTDKTKDIGILVSMGATAMGIMQTFVYCGLLMWLIGSTLGSIAGYLFAQNINGIKDVVEGVTGVEVFRSDIYNFREIPVEISMTFIGVIILGTFFMCLFFSLLPSLRASWMDPVKALRHE